MKNNGNFPGPIFNAFCVLMKRLNGPPLTEEDTAVPGNHPSPLVQTETLSQMLQGIQTRTHDRGAVLPSRFHPSYSKEFSLAGNDQGFILFYVLLTRNAPIFMASVAISSNVMTGVQPLVFDCGNRQQPKKEDFKMPLLYHTQ